MEKMEKLVTKFQMYAGLHTIGGVVASVSYGRDRVIFEFGSAYDPATAVFDGKVEPRRKNWVRDKLRVGLLPRIDGMYRREDLGAVFRLLADGAITAQVAARIPLTDATKALELAESGTVTGKVVLVTR